MQNKSIVIQNEEKMGEKAASGTFTVQHGHI